jgi:TfoX/Sxy family transcriptional regulator of competence genes
VAYDEKLAERVRRALAGKRGVTERRMFGGLAFMLRGNMFVGVESDRLMVRVGPAKYDEALKKPHAREMDFTGRPLRGYVYVDRDGFATAPALRAWIDRAIDFAKTLPAK